MRDIDRNPTIILSGKLNYHMNEILARLSEITNELSQMIELVDKIEKIEDLR